MKNTLRSHTQLILFVIFCLPFYTNFTFAQTVDYFEDWAQTSPASDNFYNNSVSVLDASDNLFTASSTPNATGYHDLLLTKTGRKGNLIWSQTFNISTTSDAMAGGITLDASGNIYVCGTVFNGNNSYDALLVKFNLLGNELWHQLYNGSASFYDGLRNITLDAATGNIYLSGSTHESSITDADFLTLAYNSSGTLQWSHHYDALSNGLNDAASTISIQSGMLVVIGPIQTDVDHWEYGRLRFQLSTGNFLAFTNTSGASNTTIDDISGLITDDAGNIYLTGSVFNTTSNNFDIRTFKFDTDLNILWQTDYVGAGGADDKGRAIAVDENDNVLVTGFTTSISGHKNFATIKYDASGVQLWDHLFKSGQDDEGLTITSDATGNVFVSGTSDILGNSDFFSYILDSNGNTKWKDRYNSLYNQDDKAFNILVDSEGDFLVMGKSADLQGETWETVKYKRHEWQNPRDPDTNSPHGYVSNRGQLMYTDQSPASDIQYYTNQQYPQMYFAHDKVSMVLTNIDTVVTTQDTMRRVDLSFINKSPEAPKRVYADEKREDYVNYYLGHIPEGRARVGLFSEVIYTDAFPDIDVLFGQEATGQSIYFVCNPGADPADIEMLFSGESSLTINQQGDLVIGTSLEDIVWPAPTAYQLDVAGNVVSLGWSSNFSLSGDKVNFTSGSYDLNKVLVIEINGSTDCMDGTVDMDNNDWTTYYSGGSIQTASDEIKGIETDQEDNVIFAGYTFHNDLPLENEEFAYMAHNDGFIVKFNDIGERQWATYYGGLGLILLMDYQLIIVTIFILLGKLMLRYLFWITERHIMILL